jgi:hypothetical protein
MPPHTTSILYRRPRINRSFSNHNPDSSVSNHPDEIQDNPALLMPPFLPVFNHTGLLLFSCPFNKLKIIKILSEVIPPGAN